MTTMAESAFCKCGHSARQHRLLNPGDRIIDDEPCKYWGCGCKEFTLIAHTQRIATRVQATCKCHEGFFGYGNTAEQAIDALYRTLVDAGQ